MNGKDLLLTLGEINLAYYDEAENDSMKVSKIRKPLRRPLLAAVILILTLLTISAAACAYSWLVKFFDKQSDMPLSPDQAAYIEGNEQIIGQSQTHDGWTIQVKSVINDGRSAYIILGVTAPKKIALESAESTEYFLGGEFADLVSNNQNIEIGFEESGWELDDDGQANTLDYTIRLEVIETPGTPLPFGDNVVWTIHIENIICQRENTEYYQSLLKGKYKNQSDIMLTDEEIDNLYQEEVFARGIWDFSFTFDQTGNGIELVSDPITVKAYATKYSAPSHQEVTITAFRLNTFSAEIAHEADALVSFTNPAKENVVVVMRDGSGVELRQRSASRTLTVLHSDAPIVLSEVDYVRMPDGTILQAKQ